jgi:hypothetical protein
MELEGNMFTLEQRLTRLGVDMLDEREYHIERNRLGHSFDLCTCCLSGGTLSGFSPGATRAFPLVPALQTAASYADTVLCCQTAGRTGDNEFE